MRKRFFGGLVLAAVMGMMGAPAANAASVFYTEQATVDATSAVPAAGPGLASVVQGGTVTGRVFTNTVNFSGIAPIGTEIRTVGAVPISSFRDAGGNVYLGVTGPGASGSQLVLAFGVQGNIVQSGADFTALFTVGRAGIFRVPNSTATGYNANDPLRWDSPDGGGARFNDAVITWQIKPQEDVLPGQGEPIGFAAAQVNLSSANSTAGQQAQGRFLFREIADPNNFLTTTTTSFNPAVDSFLDEGIFATLAQTLVVDFNYDQGTGAAIGANSLDAADLAVLEELAAFAGLTGNLSGGARFASGLGLGDPDNFNPGFSGGINITGDFAGSLDNINIHPGVQVLRGVPEPSSVLAWSLLIPGLVAFARRRRLK